MAKPALELSAVGDPEPPAPRHWWRCEQWPLVPALLARLLALALVFAGCAKGATATDAAAPPLAAAEAERGRQLCEGYVARLCRCAGTSPELAKRCELARGQPQALALHLVLLSGKEGALNARERRNTEEAARKIVAACVQDDAALPLADCPR